MSINDLFLVRRDGAWQGFPPLEHWPLLQPLALHPPPQLPASRVVHAALYQVGSHGGEIDDQPSVATTHLIAESGISREVRVCSQHGGCWSLV